MKNTLLILCSLVTLAACNKKSKPTEMSLSGKIENFPFKKLYIAEAHRWNVLLDSFDVKDGRFNYRFDTSRFNPFLVSLCYMNIEGRPKVLGVIDYVRSTLKDTFANTGFMLAYGSNEITGDFNDRFHRLSLKPTTENDLMFAGKAQNAIAARNADNSCRLIRKNKESYYLLMLLNNYKDRYTKTELEKLLQAFDKDLLRSEDAVRIAEYASFTLVNNQLPKDILLCDTGFSKVNLLAAAPLRMVVFWASWCGPCRQEIPHLKELASMYGPSQLEITSVSIDEDTAQWRKAYLEEKMPWRQLCVPKEDLLKIQAQFHFTSIPAVFFVDGSNKIVKEFRGFYTDNVHKYADFLKSR